MRPLTKRARLLPVVSILFGFIGDRKPKDEQRILSVGSVQEITEAECEALSTTGELPKWIIDLDDPDNPLRQDSVSAKTRIAPVGGGAPGRSQHRGEWISVAGLGDKIAGAGGDVSAGASYDDVSAQLANAHRLRGAVDAQHQIASVDIERDQERAGLQDDLQILDAYLYQLYLLQLGSFGASYTQVAAEALASSEDEVTRRLHRLQYEQSVAVQAKTDRAQSLVDVINCSAGEIALDLILHVRQARGDGELRMLHPMPRTHLQGRWARRAGLPNDARFDLSGEGSSEDKRDPILGALFGAQQIEPLFFRDSDDNGHLILVVLQ